ncbi:MAG: coiled-coil domain-containing protein, partial [Treponema sp.]
ETQYKSDLSRLNFIVDGQIHYEKTEKTDCPFCHNEISIKENPDYVSVSIHKYKKIKMQISDLANAMQDLENEIKQINNEIKILNDKKNKLDQEINEQLKPKIYELKNKLQIYENYIKKSNEIKILKDICVDKNKYISDQQNIKSNNTNYDPKEYLLENMFFTEFSEMIKTILEKGHFENLNTISIDEKTVDVIINGQKKSDNGKGYRAYFNSITSISLIRYLFEKAIYKPSILILDSPLLSLKLEENEESTQHIKQSIKDGMFEILTNFPNKLQTIVIENEIPEVNDKSVNIIRFTKNKTTGRYGFLNEVYD